MEHVALLNTLHIAISSRFLQGYNRDVLLEANEVDLEFERLGLNIAHQIILCRKHESCDIIQRPQKVPFGSSGFMYNGSNLPGPIGWLTAG